MTNKIENPINILNDSNELEYVVKDTDLISAMHDMQIGESLWYRDYDGTGSSCISLYKRISKAMYVDEEVFIIAYDLCYGDPSSAVIVQANTTDEQLRDAFKQMYEWVPEYRRYQSQMLVDEEVFEHHFRA